MDAHFLNESIYGIDKKPRSMQQWEEISLSNTQRFSQMGCQVPMAWVLVRGKNIPPNAIIAGECRRQPLYIARTFYEGGVYIGQAALHLEKGASFAYLGREVHVDTYEVLVPLQQTIKYEIAEHYSVPTIPRITRTAPAPLSVPRSIVTEPLVDISVTQLVQKLRAIKVVMVIDDSSSMLGALWDQARLALVGLVSVIENDFSANGIDLCFLNNPRFESNIKDSLRVQNVFDTVFPQGVTPTGSKLRELFNRYLPLVEDPARSCPPIVIMVITDGVPTDKVEDVIVECARRQDQQRVPLRRFGVSFLQIGNDPDAADFLKELDDDISRSYGCRDMVDATPYNPKTPELTQEVFFKCVMGSIDPYYDNLVEIPRPRSTASPYQPMPSYQMPSYGTPMSPAFARMGAMTPLAN